VKRRSDVVIYKVTARNHDSLTERLTLDIQAALRSARAREAQVGQVV
jgi:hypothetical protein